MLPNNIKFVGTNEQTDNINEYNLLRVLHNINDFR